MSPHLAASTERYVYEHPPEVIDLGLRLEQCEAMGLLNEAVSREIDPKADTANLQRWGATEREIRFLVGRRRRIELNAMSSPVFVKWLEGQLRKHGAGKVVPGDDLLEKAFWLASVEREIEQEITKLEADAKGRLELAERRQAPHDLRADVERMLAEDPTLSWKAAVRQLVRPTPAPTPETQVEAMRRLLSRSLRRKSPR